MVLCIIRDIFSVLFIAFGPCAVLHQKIALKYSITTLLGRPWTKNAIGNCYMVISMSSFFTSILSCSA